MPVLVVTSPSAGCSAGSSRPPPSPLPDGDRRAGSLLNLLSAAILAPIGEELFFRGFATTAWARAVGPAAAIVRGAVFFAFAHVVTLFDASFAVGAQRALFSFLVLLPVAIALGWVFLRRRSLYAAIGLHGAFNAIQVLLLLAAAAAARWALSTKPARSPGVSRRVRAAPSLRRVPGSGRRGKSAGFRRPDPGDALTGGARGRPAGQRAGG